MYKQLLLILLLLGSVGLVSADLNDSLVFSYSFDGDFNDSLGNYDSESYYYGVGEHLFINDTTKCVLNECISVIGEMYILNNYTKTFQKNESFSLNFWYYVEDSYGHFFRTSESLGFNSFGFYESELYFISGDFDNYVYLDKSLFYNTFNKTMFTFVKNSEQNVISVYIDTVLISNVTDNTITEFILSGFLFGFEQVEEPMILDEINFWEKTLTQEEIDLLYDVLQEPEPEPEPEPQGLNVGIVSHWSFEIDGRDDVGVNNFTNYGATHLPSGSINNGSFSFNSSNTEFLKTTSLQGINDSNEGTLAFWFNPSEEDTLQVLLEMSSESLEGQLRVLRITENVIEVRLTTSDSTIRWTLNSSIELNANETHHFLLTHNGSRVNLYVNGLLSDGVDSNYWIDEIDMTVIRVSGWNNTGGSPTSFHYDGEIDEITFWNRSLSQSEINFLQLSYYPFDGYNSSEPVVNLINPPLDYITNNTFINFTFNTTTSNGVSKAILNIYDNTTNLSVYSEEENFSSEIFIEHTFEVNFTEHIELIDFFWNVEVIDIYGLIGFSENRTLTTEPIYGCSDPLAENYNEYVTVDNNSCVYIPTIDYFYPEDVNLTLGGNTQQLFYVNVTNGNIFKWFINGEQQYLDSEQLSFNEDVITRQTPYPLPVDIDGDNINDSLYVCGTLSSCDSQYFDTHLMIILSDSGDKLYIPLVDDVSDEYVNMSQTTVLLNITKAPINGGYGYMSLYGTTSSAHQIGWDGENITIYIEGENINSLLINTSDLGFGVYDVSVNVSNGFYSVSQEWEMTIFTNSAPVLTNVRVSPNQNIGDNINVQGYCTATDSEGDVLTYYYMWYVNNALVRSGNISNAQGVEVLVDTIPSSFYNAEDYLRFGCYANDGLVDSNSLNTTQYFIYSITNYPPTMTSATLTPSGSHPTTQNFTLTVLGSDINTPTIQYQYQYMKNNQIQGTLNTAFVNQNTIQVLNPLLSSSTKAGEVWKARARAYDGTSYSSWLETNSITIQNTLPVITTLEITNTPYQNVTINGLCTATDIDSEQTLSYEYRWRKNNTIQSITTNQLSYAFTQGDEVWDFGCRAYDGMDYTNWQYTANFTIINTSNVPVMQSVTLSGLNFNNDGLTGYCRATDSDGDKLNYNYTFYKNGVDIINGSFTNVDQDVTQSIEVQPTVQVGDSFIFGCYASDDDGTTAVVNSTAFVIPPVTFNYYVTQITETSFRLSWLGDMTSVLVYIDGVLVVETQLGQYLVENRNPSQTYEIRLRPKKGIYFDEPRIFNVTTESTDNNPPVMLNSTITPANVFTNTAVTGFCHANDIDDIRVFYLYEWRVNNITVGSGVTNFVQFTTPTSIGSLLSTNYDSGDVISLYCQANDGVFSSSVLVTNVSVQNTPPVLTETFVTQQDDVFVCSYEYEDIDGDEITNVTYEWFKNNVSHSNNTNVSFDDFEFNDKITCEINVTNDYHSVLGMSEEFLFGDFELPVITIQNVPTVSVTGSVEEFKIICTDNVGVASGFPRVRFINPNLIEQVFPLFHQGNNVYTRYHTFSTAGQYTNVEFECADGNNNRVFEQWNNFIQINQRETVIVSGGSGGIEYVEVPPVTSFLLEPFIQTINIGRGQTLIGEFEVKNVGATDISFVTAILRSTQNPETYDWINFDGSRKTATFDINLLGGLSANNKYIRYIVSIPNDVEIGSYVGIIEVNGNEITEQLQIEINVVDGFNLFLFLNQRLFDIPFTQSPTGAVTSDGIEITVGTPIRVWHSIILGILVGAFIIGYGRLRVGARRK